MVSNPNFYGQSTTGTPNQIEDGVDYPHTGLLKALSTGLSGNYAISGFDASGVTATAITIAAGVIIQNGKRVAVTGATLALSATYINGYHLLVAPSSGAVVLRNPTAADKVPAYTDGDTVIGILVHTGASPMQIQYLTLNPKTNSLSVAYDSAGTYTEAVNIQGDSDGMKINTLPAVTPVTTDKVLIQQVSANDAIKTITVQNILDNVGLLRDGDNDTKIQVEEAADEDKIRFDTAGSERMIIDDTGKVGIGTSSPVTDLHIQGSDDGISELRVSRNSNEYTEIMHEDAGGSFITIHSRESNKKPVHFDSAHDNTGSAAGALEQRFRIQDAGTTTMREYLTITESGDSSNKEVVINDSSRDVDFRVESDASTHALFVDGGTDKIGIGTSSPASKLEVGGKITSGGTNRGYVSKNSADMSYNISATDDYYIKAQTTAGAPPTNGPLTLTLPAIAAGDEGLSYKIIVTQVAATPDDLTLGSQVGDLIHDARGASLGNSTVLSAKTYEIVCTDAAVWTLIQLD